MSTEGFSGEHTKSILTILFNLLPVHFSPDLLETLHSILRKSAHLTEYAVLSFLLYRSMGGRDYVHNQGHLMTWCVAASAAYSLTDEFHQSFVRGRNASLKDCGIDTTGAVIAMLAVYGSSKLKARRTASLIPIQAGRH